MELEPNQRVVVYNKYIQHGGVAVVVDPKHCLLYDAKSFNLPEDVWEVQVVMLYGTDPGKIRYYHSDNVMVLDDKFAEVK